MRYPSLTRINMRFRGPMESHKLNKSHTDILYDMQDLYARVDKLKEDTEAFSNETKAGGNNMSSRIITARKKGAFLKGGDSRE